MSENIGVATGKIMLKIVIALFKGVWNLQRSPGQKRRRNA